MGSVSQKKTEIGNSVALYVRVSTTDQNCEMQLRELREYVTRRGWTIQGEYADVGWSGAKASRPQLDALMQGASRRLFDTVVVWKLDRFGRSLRNCIDGIETLKSCGVRFIATTQGIDTDKSNPMSTFMIHILGAAAEFERQLAYERSLAGALRYRQDYEAGKAKSNSGKNLPIGRPRRVFRRDEAVRMRSEGMSWRTIAKALGVPVMTIVGACTETTTPAGQSERRKGGKVAAR